MPLYFLIAAGLGALFFWLALRSVPLGELGRYLETLSWPSLLGWSGAFLALYVPCHVARVVRWRELLRPLGDRVEGRLVHKACLVGMTAILLMPLRLGELVTPYLLSRRTNLRMNAILGTAIVERVIDGLVITGMLFLTLSTYTGSQSTAFAYSTGVVSALVFSGALGVCVLALWRRPWALRLVEWTFGWMSAGLAKKLAAMLGDFIDGFQALVAARAMGRFLGLTVVYWGTNVASMWVLARWGFGLEVGAWEMVCVLAILVIGIMFPGPPGMAGNFELFMIQGLSLFVLTETHGPQMMAFAATVHVLQMVTIVVPGVVVMMQDAGMRHLVQLSEDAREQMEHEGGEGG